MKTKGGQKLLKPEEELEEENHLTVSSTVKKK